MGRISRDSWIYNTKIAHRGLHGDGCAENTLPAYERAIDAGYAIETDIHLTRDGQVVVFHDHELTRATDGKCCLNIEQTDFEELKSIPLFGTDDCMPLFADFLKTVGGRVPILIELKVPSCAGNELAVAADEILRDYCGEYAVQSFNPMPLLWYAKNRPDVIRGQLSTLYRKVKGAKNMNPLVRTALRRMSMNGRTKPDFISFIWTELPNKYVDRYVKKTGAAVLCWTVRSQDEYDKVRGRCDNIIFEKFIPADV